MCKCFRVVRDLPVDVTLHRARPACVRAGSDHRPEDAATQLLRVWNVSEVTRPGDSEALGRQINGLATRNFSAVRTKTSRLHFAEFISGVAQSRL